MKYLVITSVVQLDLFTLSELTAVALHLLFCVRNYTSLYKLGQGGFGHKFSIPVAAFFCWFVFKTLNGTSTYHCSRVHVPGLFLATKWLRTSAKVPMDQISRW